MRTPFEDLLSLRSELERLASGIGREAVPRGAVYPAVNIYDDGERFMVRAEVPGMNREAIDISAKGEQLTIRGERVVKPVEAQAAYHRREREGGTFRRVVTLPERIDVDRIEASYDNGVLEVVVPRAAEAKPRQIKVR